MDCKIIMNSEENGEKFILMRIIKFVLMLFLLFFIISICVILVITLSESNNKHSRYGKGHNLTLPYPENTIRDLLAQPMMVSESPLNNTTVKSKDNDLNKTGEGEVKKGQKKRFETPGNPVSEDSIDSKKIDCVQLCRFDPSMGGNRCHCDGPPLFNSKALKH